MRIKALIKCRVMLPSLCGWLFQDRAMMGNIAKPSTPVKLLGRNAKREAALKKPTSDSGRKNPSKTTSRPVANWSVKPPRLIGRDCLSKSFQADQSNVGRIRLNFHRKIPMSSATGKSWLRTGKGGRRKHWGRGGGPIKTRAR